MAFKILIVEDEDLYADQLEMLVEKAGYQWLATVNNSNDALNILATQQPDLILMDVHIKGNHDGIELAKIIHEQANIPIIFITSMKDDLTFNRASRAKPVQFLLKPFDNLQLQRTIQLVVKQLEQQEVKSSDENWNNDFLSNGNLFIKNRQRIDRIKVEDLLYVEADGHYCQVHTTEKKYLIRISLSELIKQLPDRQFIQSHRSFWINAQAVQSIDLDDSIIYIGSKHVPLSKRNRESVLKQLNWI